MAVSFHLSFLHFFLSAIIALLYLSKLGFCATQYLTGWSSAGATWYGSANGAGSDGGACGYGNMVSQPPFSSLISAAGPSIFKSGKGCGSCFEVKCTSSTHRSCSGKPVRVVITDNCPGGPCTSGSGHFDLSGTAFGAMANPGQEEALRGAGTFKIDFARVACEYPGKALSFKVDPGSNPYYMAVVVLFQGGDGDLGSIEMKEAASGEDKWRAMQQSWGAVWKLDASGSPFRPPFSFRLKTQHSGKTLVARDVIPVGWQAGQTYQSSTNF